MKLKSYKDGKVFCKVVNNSPSMLVVMDSEGAKMAIKFKEEDKPDYIKYKGKSVEIEIKDNPVNRYVSSIELKEGFELDVDIPYIVMMEMHKRLSEADLGIYKFLSTIIYNEDIEKHKRILKLGEYPELGKDYYDALIGILHATNRSNPIVKAYGEIYRDLFHVTSCRFIQERTSRFD